MGIEYNRVTGENATELLINKMQILHEIIDKIPAGPYSFKHVPTSENLTLSKGFTSTNLKTNKNNTVLQPVITKYTYEMFCRDLDIDDRFVNQLLEHIVRETVSRSESIIKAKIENHSKVFITNGNNNNSSNNNNTNTNTNANTNANANANSNANVNSNLHPNHTSERGYFYTRFVDSNSFCTSDFDSEAFNNNTVNEHRNITNYNQRSTIYPPVAHYSTGNPLTREETVILNDSYIQNSHRNNDYLTTRVLNQTQNRTNLLNLSHNTNTENENSNPITQSTSSNLNSSFEISTPSTISNFNQDIQQNNTINHTVNNPNVSTRLSNTVIPPIAQPNNILRNRSQSGNTIAYNSIISQNLDSGLIGLNINFSPDNTGSGDIQNLEQIDGIEVVL